MKLFTKIIVLVLLSLVINGCPPDSELGLVDCQTTCPIPGNLRCNDQVLQVCLEDSNGCFEWQEQLDCVADGQICQVLYGQEQCVCLENCSVPDDLRCDGDVLQACQENIEGCFEWQDQLDCRDNERVCQVLNGQAQCVRLIDCSILGDQRCDDDLLQVCQEGLDGRLKWQDQLDCAADNRVCQVFNDQAQCICFGDCSVPGDQRCDNDMLQVCQEDSNGCLKWQDQLDCAADDRVCQVPDDQAQCVCLRNCSGKECGSDGCGGVCPPGCPDGLACNANGQCGTECQNECEPAGYPACDGVKLLNCVPEIDGCYDHICTDCPAGEECQGKSGSASCELILPDLPRPTHLFALPKGPGRIHLGWRMVSPHPQLGYNVYRSTVQGGPYEMLNATPVFNQTNYRDTTVNDGVNYFYVVRLVNENGLESPDSLEVRVKAANTDTGRYISFSGFNTHPGVDNWCEFMFGDVDGDNIPEFLQACQNTKAEPPKTHLAVFDRNGTRLWLHENISDWTKSAMPWTFVDLDGDGRDEVVGVIYNDTANNIRAVAYDGLTGTELHRSQPIANKPGLCKGQSFLSPAMLDGQSWSVIVQTCITKNRRRTVTALGSSLDIQWQYIIPAGDQPGGAYNVRGVDIDGDGKDEVLAGGSILESNGSLLKAFPFNMVTGIRVGDIRPDKQGLEIFYFNKNIGDPEAVLNTTTSQLWKINKTVTSKCIKCGHEWQDPIRRGRSGWIGDVHSNPGLECFATYYWEPICPICNKKHATKWIHRLYSSTGKVLGTNRLPIPIDWDGKLPLETKRPNVNGKLQYYAADIIGDYREEYIVMRVAGANLTPSGMIVLTNTSTINAKKPSPWEKRDYIIDKRWTGYR